MSGIYKSTEGERVVRERTLELQARWPAPCERRSVPTRQGETSLIACGPADAPPLVLLHGSGATSLMWMGDVPVWSSAFRLYAVDMIGEPGLSAQARPALASDAHALWLDDVLAGLGVARAALVGVSLGGWLALDFATRRPERVRALALLCPGGVGRQRNVLWKLLPLLLLGPAGRRKALSIVLGAPPASPTAEERAMGEYISLIFAHFRPRTDRLPRFSDEALQRLSMPLLAIVGARDAMLDSADTARRLAATVPHAEIALLPDQGHLLRGQTERILAFLRKALLA